MTPISDLIEGLRREIDSADAPVLFETFGELASLTARAHARMIGVIARAMVSESHRLANIEQSITATTKPSGGQMLTEEEAARMRRKSVHALRKERQRSMGPRWVRDGRRILYPKADLVAWLRDREHETADTRRAPRLPQPPQIHRT